MYAPRNEHMARAEWRDEMTRGAPDARMRAAAPAKDEHVVRATPAGLEMSQGTVWPWHEISAVHLSHQWYRKLPTWYGCRITGPGGYTQEISTWAGADAYPGLLKAIHHNLGPHAAKVRFTAGSWLNWAGSSVVLLGIWAMCAPSFYVAWVLGFPYEALAIALIGLSSSMGLLPTILFRIPGRYRAGRIPWGFRPW